MDTPNLDESEKDFRFTMYDLRFFYVFHFICWIHLSDCVLHAGKSGDRIHNTQIERFMIISNTISFTIRNLRKILIPSIRWIKIVGLVSQTGLIKGLFGKQPLHFMIKIAQFGLEFINSCLVPALQGQYVLSRLFS